MSGNSQHFPMLHDQVIWGWQLHQCMCLNSVVGGPPTILDLIFFTKLACRSIKCKNKEHKIFNTFLHIPIVIVVVVYNEVKRVVGNKAGIRKIPQGQWSFHVIDKICSDIFLYFNVSETLNGTLTENNFPPCLV